jgi:glycosyltransferase involved in cell wall biosynthesis
LNSSDQKISILFVIDGLEFGGGERVFLQLASGLRNRYRVFVATSANGSFAYELDKLGIQLFSVDMLRQLTSRPIRQIKDIIRHNEIDLLHSQGSRADFFARVAGKLAGVPHIICTVAMLVEGYDVGSVRKSIYRFMDHMTERYVDRFIVVSDYLRNTLIDRRGLPTESVIRIYNGIELDNYHPYIEGEPASLRDQWNIPQDVPLIGAVGRMVWQKGLKYLIQAVPAVQQVSPEVWFLFVGEGPLRPDLESLAHQLNVHDRVVFTGFRSDIAQILSTIDILVAPSLLEGFPMITLEAMAMAKPVVATNIQGIAEQISEGQEGILVPSRNPEALAGAVLRLIHDKDLSSRIGATARRKVESCFSVQEMVKETEKVYLSLLQRNYGV